MQDNNRQPTDQQPESVPVRVKLTELLSLRHPEAFADNNIPDDDTLFSLILADYEADNDELNKMREQRDTINSLFASDPRSAQFLADWHNGDDPAVALIRTYGKDQIMAAINDPQRIEEIARADKEYVERVAENKRLEQEFEANLKQSLELIDKRQEELQLTDDDIDEALTLLQKITTDNVRGIITPETISLIVSAVRHDEDVEQASHEAEIRGRNAKIEEMVMQGDVVPNLGGFSSMRGGAGSDTLRRLGRITQENDIWRRGGYK